MLNIINIYFNFIYKTSKELWIDCPNEEVLGGTQDPALRGQGSELNGICE
jgi:hypothetical protein